MQLRHTNDRSKESSTGKTGSLRDMGGSGLFRQLGSNLVGMGPPRYMDQKRLRVGRLEGELWKFDDRSIWCVARLPIAQTVIVNVEGLLVYDISCRACRKSVVY